MYGKLKKKYGQNFLIDENILKKICNLIPNNKLNILEIGPGDGRLTKYILKSKPKEVLLIEIDSDLIPILNNKFKEDNEIKIINDDILNYQFIKKFDLIISNLPYNISSQVLVKLCLLDHVPLNLILMFQKEFASRLIQDELNSLNALVKCFYNIDTSFDVSKNCFRPIPKIDSTVLYFQRRNNILLNKIEVDNFIEFKRNIFSKKRKTLKKILKNYKFNKEKFDISMRVEDINLDQLLKIFREINL